MNNEGGKIHAAELTMFLWVLMFAQTQGAGNTVSPGSAKEEAHDCLALVGMLENYRIVYEKGGGLHDAPIEKIERIEFSGASRQIIIFDNKNKPVVRAYTY